MRRKERNLMFDEEISQPVERLHDNPVKERFFLYTGSTSKSQKK